jgi:hypothetical protein
MILKKTRSGRGSSARRCCLSPGRDRLSDCNRHEGCGHRELIHRRRERGAHRGSQCDVCAVEPRSRPAASQTDRALRGSSGDGRFHSGHVSRSSPPGAGARCASGAGSPESGQLNVHRAAPPTGGYLAARVMAIMRCRAGAAERKAFFAKSWRIVGTSVARRNLTSRDAERSVRQRDVTGTVSQQRGGRA